MTTGDDEIIIVAERSFLGGARILLVRSDDRSTDRQRLTRNDQVIELLVALDSSLGDAQGGVEQNSALQLSFPQSMLDQYAKQKGLPAYSVAQASLEEFDGLLRHLANAAAMLLHEDSNPCVEQSFDSILQAVCAQIMRHSDAPRDATHRGGLAQHHLVRAKRKMMANLGTDIKLREIAGECFLSESHFVRAFKATVGCSPVRWLSEQRIEEAKRLLFSNTMSLKTIATQCGYADQASFTRIFRRRTGTTPSEWRRYRTTMQDDLQDELIKQYCD